MSTAVALRYDRQLPAPFLLAKGKEELAARMRKLALEHGVPVVEDAALADALYILQPQDLIPEEFYRVVAEVLVFIGAVDEAGQKR